MYKILESAYKISTKVDCKLPPGSLNPQIPPGIATTLQIELFPQKKLFLTFSDPFQCEIFGNTVCKQTSRPDPAQPQLSTGRWQRGVWVGEEGWHLTSGDSQKVFSLTVTQNSWPEQQHPGGGQRKGGCVPSPSLSYDNLERPDWTDASSASWANPLAVVVVLQSDIWFFVCPSFCLIMSESANLGQNVHLCEYLGDSSTVVILPLDIYISFFLLLFRLFFLGLLPFICGDSG